MRTHEIHLDKPRILKYSNMAMLELEDKLGVPLLNVMGNEEILLKARTLSLFLWAGLSHEGLSFEEVAELVPFKRLYEVAPILIKAVGLAVGASEEKYDEEIKKLEKKSKSRKQA